MNQRLPTPSVPILARAKGETLEETTDWFIEYFNKKGPGWNYIRGTRIIKHAYRGFHNILGLTAACEAEKNKSGRSANRDLVQNVAPLAFGRDIQVFDLPVRRFSFGHRQAGFRIPFFFVEQQVIKLYYLQPTKSLRLSYDELCMIATIYKKYLLDTEFYGQETDIEFIEASAPDGKSPRDVRSFKLSEFELWDDKRLTERLTIISQALDQAEMSSRVQPRRRTAPQPVADMPLFG